MIYLASPYSHPDQLVRKTRFLLAEEATAALIRQGHVTFSPIVHCHEMAMKHNFPTDFDFWQKYCITSLRHCSELFVLTIPGWDESRGVTAEINFARSAHMGIAYITQGGIFIDAHH